MQKKNVYSNNSCWHSTYWRCNLAFLFTWLCFLLCLEKHVSHAFNVAPKSGYVATMPSRNDKSSYFGYSVALLETSPTKWTLLAGAPRANSSGSSTIFEPGALFKCPIQGECSEVVVDNYPQNSRIVDLSSNSKSNRNRAWTGAALDIDERGNVVVCAPRWKNAYYRNEYHIGGVCYILGKDLDDNSSLIFSPMLNIGKQVYNYFGRGIYFYANGQCGMDVHFTSEKNLLLGMPGVLNWQGSVASYLPQGKVPSGGISKRETSTYYTLEMIPNPLFSSNILDSDYFGYAITSGKFYEKLHYVAGAPRGARSIGMVHIYLMRKYEDQPLFIKETRQGTQFGEYFGASVAALDLNGDGYSDLVAGAPLHSENDLYEVGCVYVYINNFLVDGHLSRQAVQLYGDMSEGARFGSALGTPGDIDLDGYEDLLVGAPYENEGSGAVYIFMGSRDGIRTKYSQKLLPEKAAFSPGTLKGFGISFSRKADVDRNKYPDFAVGSFLSDSAALMYTRPVITASGRISSNPSKLSLTERSFNAIVCLTYEGIGVQEETDFQAEVSLMQESVTGEILTTFSDSGSTEISVTFNGRKNEEVCNTLKVDFNPQKSDNKPVTISMSYGLKHDKLEGSTNPIMRPYQTTAAKLTLSFVTGCGNVDSEGREICNSDLKAYAKFSEFDMSSFLLVGKTEKISLELEVSNKGDPAFLPQAILKVPRPIIPLPTEHDCYIKKESNFTVVICDVENPLKKNKKDTLLVDLDLSQMDDYSKNITIELSVNSTADLEVNPDDNIYVATLQVVKQTDIKVSGWSQPEQITYERKSEHEMVKTEAQDIEYKFSVTKTDATPLRSVHIEVDVPLSINTDEKEFLIARIISNTVTLGKRTLPCEVVPSKKPDKKLQSMKHPPPHVSIRTGGITSIDCNSKTVNCSTIRCTVGPWKRLYNVASLTIALNVNLTTLSEIISVKEGFSIFSKIQANVLDHSINELQGQTHDEATVQTMFHPGPLPAEPLAWWIYLLAALGGLLLLLVIALILYKLGFFRRKTKEQLLKAQEATVHKNNEDL